LIFTISARTALPSDFLWVQINFDGETYHNTGKGGKARRPENRPSIQNMGKTSTKSNAQDRLRRIVGRHNSLAKQVRQAFARAERTEDGFCAIDGVRIVEEAIRSGLKFRAVLFKESAENVAERLLPQIGAHVETLLLPDELFDRIVPSETPQGVAALVRLREFSIEDVIERLQVGPVIVLVGLQDPGNLGTILRSAEAFGSAGVILGEGTVSPYNSKAIRASAGSIFRLPFVLAKTSAGTEDISSKLRAASVRLIAASSHKGTPIDQAELARPSAVFIGSEGSGLPRNLMAQVDELVAIPHSQHVESLNAGVAGSIVLYEAARQRRE
jgi:TrmH family RNA methyltransferase